MSVDKLVDSTQLDSDLTSVANAIRAKSGGSSQLAFPSGFVSEIGNIPSGGSGYSVDDICAHNYTGVITYTGTQMRAGAFADSKITEFHGTNITDMSGAQRSYIFYQCTDLTVVELPNVEEFSNASSMFERCSSLPTLSLPKLETGSSYMCTNCQSLRTVVLPSIKTNPGSNSFSSCQINVFDYGNANNNTAMAIANRMFNGATVNTLILRKTNGLVTADSNYMPTNWANGGAGGTIYIPKVLYDHLGDGTSLDYKAATNWSTFNGYGTLTWAKIEGSQYEHYYADGTAIPTS